MVKYAVARDRACARPCRSGHARAAGVGVVRLGELRVLHHGRHRGLSGVLRHLCRRPASSRRRPPRGSAPITTASVALIAIVSPILGAIADITGIKKKLLLGFMLVGVASTARDGLHRARRLDARVDALRHRQHRRVGHDGVLRLAAAARRAAGRDRPRIVGGLRARLSRRRRAAAPEPRLDPAAADVRLCGRRGGDEGVVRQRGRVVAALLDSAAAARARASGRARSGRARGRQRRSSRRSAGSAAPSARSADTAGLPAVRWRCCSTRTASRRSSAWRRSTAPRSASIRTRRSRRS